MDFFSFGGGKILRMLKRVFNPNIPIIHSFIHLIQHNYDPLSIHYTRQFSTSRAIVGTQDDANHHQHGDEGTDGPGACAQHGLLCSVLWADWCLTAGIKETVRSRSPARAQGGRHGEELRVAERPTENHDLVDDAVAMLRSVVAR